MFNYHFLFDVAPVNVFVFIHGALPVFEQFLEVVALDFEGDCLFFDTTLDGKLKPHAMVRFLRSAHVVRGCFD